MDQKTPEAERAKRLNDLIERGPRPPRSPHEFIQDKMREERRKDKEKRNAPQPAARPGSKKD
jgi:hypothetical protein